MSIPLLLRTNVTRSFTSTPRILKPSTTVNFVASFNHTLRAASTMSTPDTSVYDFTPLNAKGEPFPLADLKGKVILIVNVASKYGPISGKL